MTVERKSDSLHEREGGRKGGRGTHHGKSLHIMSYQLIDHSLHQTIITVLWAFQLITINNQLTDINDSLNFDANCFTAT